MFFIFSNTPVLAFSIDVVFILSIRPPSYLHSGISYTGKTTSLYSGPSSRPWAPAAVKSIQDESNSLSESVHVKNHKKCAYGLGFVVIYTSQMCPCSSRLRQLREVTLKYPFEIKVGITAIN